MREGEVDQHNFLIMQSDLLQFIIFNAYQREKICTNLDAVPLVGARQCHQVAGRHRGNTLSEVLCRNDDSAATLKGARHLRCQHRRTRTALWEHSASAGGAASLDGTEVVLLLPYDCPPAA